MLKLLKVIEHEKTVAIEFSVVDGYPDTFTMTWDELFLKLPAGATKEEAVVLATLLLKQKVAGGNKSVSESTNLLSLAQAALEDEA